MNTVRSLCTSKFLVLLGLVLCAQPAPAQKIWEEGRNIAGVAAGDDTGHEATAEIFGKYTSGDFRSPSQGKTLWTAGATAQAESRFKDLYLSGNFGFELVEGSQMMGSMFTEPGYFPIDIVEFTPGTKVKQTYDIGGGIALRTGGRWIPGSYIRFRGVNYAKRKDLRHTTYREEFELNPSLLYQGDGWKAGATVLFDKISEFVVAEQIGEAPTDPYMAFLDKGIRYGTLQVWDGSGTHLKEAGVDRLPVKEYGYGLALQAELGSFLYADAEYRTTRGEVGEKGYTWFRFPGQALAVQVIGTIPAPAGRHQLRASLDWSGRDNYETVLEKETNGGVTTPVEYGSNRIFQNRNLQGGLSWRFAHRERWAVESGVSLEKTRDRSTLIYPFLDNDEATHLRLSVGGRLPLGQWTFAGGVLAGCKVGEHRHTVENDNENLGVSSFPYRLQDWWDREQEAADATRLTVNLSIRYSFARLLHLPLYVEAGCRWMHAFDIQLLPGSDRQTTFFKIGYNY